jgi:hypothetical protein
MSMDDNPYRPSQEPNEPPQPSSRNFVALRRKPLWGYPIAIVVGALVIGIAILPATSALDDVGGTQMLIGGFLGLVIYALLF